MGGIKPHILLPNKFGPENLAITCGAVHDGSVQLFIVTKSYWYSVLNGDMNQRLMLPPVAEMIHLQSEFSLYSCSPSDILPKVNPFDGSHRHPPEQVTLTLGMSSAGAGVLVSPVDVVGVSSVGVVLVLGAGVVLVLGAGVVLVVTSGVVLVVASGVVLVVASGVVLVVAPGVVLVVGAGVVLVLGAGVVLVVGAGVVLVVAAGVSTLALTYTTSDNSETTTTSMLGSMSNFVLTAATNFALASATEKDELLYLNRASTVT